LRSTGLTLGHVRHGFPPFVRSGLSGTESAATVRGFRAHLALRVRRGSRLVAFNASYALCQFLPGPNVVNLSVIFGGRIRGPLGSLVALVGLIGPPFVIVSVLALAYARFGAIAALQRMLVGIAAAAAGLVLGTCAKMALPLLRDRFALAPSMALVTFAAIGVMRWPLHWSLALLVPVSIAIAWVRR